MSIQLAREIAVKAHEGQLYGEAPYHLHLGQVAYSVSQGTTDLRLVEVAWLHDILEDTAVQEQTLRMLFEDNVVDAVVAISRKPGMEKALYLERCRANPMARIVKIHDSLCNLTQSTRRFDQKRIKKYAEQIAFLVG